jgi:hypothetical protein
MRAGSHPSILYRATAGLVAGAIALAGAPSIASAQDKPSADKPAGDKPAADKPAADKPPAAKPVPWKTRNEAKKAFDQGQKNFEAGDFAAAQENFQKANELVPSALAQFWLAMSLSKQQGKEAEAVTAFEAFLNNPEASQAGDEKIEQARSATEELRAKLVGHLSLTSEPAGATVTVDGVAQEGQTPMELKLPPGPHKLLITAAGHVPQELEVQAAGGEKLERQVTLAPEPPPEPPPAPAVEPAPAPPPPPPPAPEPRSKVPAYVTLGIAGAGAIVGTIFGLKALSAKSDFDDNPTEDNADEVERNALFADIAFGVAITVGITGVVLLTSSDEPIEEANYKKLPSKARLEVTPYVGPKGGGAAARVSF